MKKTTIISIVIILVVVIAGGVIFYQQSQPKTSGKIMTVGKYYWPGMYWVEIAEAIMHGTYDYLVKSDWKIKDVVAKVRERLEG